MNSRDKLLIAIKNYCFAFHNLALQDDEAERLLAGTMAFIAVEMTDRPFTMIVPPVVMEREEEETNG